MIVVFDANMLSLLLHQTARIPHVPGTGKPVIRARDRIAHLVGELGKARATIIIPAPVLTEFLVVVDEAGPKYVQILDKNSRFKIEPFDTVAATEAARMYKRGVAEGDWKLGAEGHRQKIKIDHQIVAIAKVRQARYIYTTDKDVRKIAAHLNIPTIAVWELPLPSEDEPSLDFEKGDPVTSPASSNEPAQPGPQSPVAEPEKDSSPAPGLPSAPHASPGPQQPGSSPTVVPPPRSEK